MTCQPVSVTPYPTVSTSAFVQIQNQPSSYLWKVEEVGYTLSTFPLYFKSQSNSIVIYGVRGTSAKKNQKKKNPR